MTVDQWLRALVVICATYLLISLGDACLQDSFFQDGMLSRWSWLHIIGIGLIFASGFIVARNIK